MYNIIAIILRGQLIVHAATAVLSSLYSRFTRICWRRLAKVFNMAGFPWWFGGGEEQSGIKHARRAATGLV